MNSHPKPEAHPTRTAVRSGRSSRTSIEKLAADSHRPLEFIEQLYTRELTILQGEARIQTFVPVVALRRVREALRRGH